MGMLSSATDLHSLQDHLALHFNNFVPLRPFLELQKEISSKGVACNGSVREWKDIFAADKEGGKIWLRLSWLSRAATLDSQFRFWRRCIELRGHRSQSEYPPLSVGCVKKMSISTVQ